MTAVVSRRRKLAQNENESEEFSAKRKKKIDMTLTQGQSKVFFPRFVEARSIVRMQPDELRFFGLLRRDRSDEVHFRTLSAELLCDPLTCDD